MKADLIIRSNGNGDVGALLKPFIAVSGWWGLYAVYLDQWDTDTKSVGDDLLWYRVLYLDYLDGLSDPSIDITFKNQDKDIIISER